MTNRPATFPQTTDYTDAEKELLTRIVIAGENEPTKYVQKCAKCGRWASVIWEAAGLDTPNCCRHFLLTDWVRVYWREVLND